MKVGTKSLLFGYHQFLLHPLFVWAGWVKLFGWTWDPRIIAAFFLHDIGYWGKPNMDGMEGTSHPFAGAMVMHQLFDGFEGGCSIADDAFSGLSNGLSRSARWYLFSLYHSRQIAKIYFCEPSQLCWADKKAFMLYPVWLLRVLYFFSKEDVEYRMNIYKDGERIPQPSPIPFKEWYMYTVDGNKIPENIRRKK